MAVNSVTNIVYVTTPETGSVTVIDGATNSTTSISTGGYPGAVAINTTTDKIYVATSDGRIIIIDGATNATTTMSGGVYASSIAVDPIANRIYLANLGDNADIGSVIAIGGATNTSTTINDVNALYPSVLAVNTVNNKVYVANLGSRNVTVIDGGTNHVSTLSAGNRPSAVAVSPFSNNAYVANLGDGTVTIISESIQPIPLQSSIAALSGNQTANAAPSFTFKGGSSFTPFAPPIDNLFYQVDTWLDPWTAAAPQNSGSFTGSTGPLTPGFHILYAYATDGEEATATNAGSQSSPLVSNVTAYGFLVVKATPTVSLTGAPATALYLSTFTVGVISNASTSATITASGA